jgi:hypothetical protein
LFAFSLIAALAALAATAAATDAPVRYGTINCRNVKDAPFKACQVALVPRGEAKTAAYVTAPDGRVRIIHFRRGDPSSTDAGSQLRFERNRDTLVIRVGRVEVYEMPDRLVTGE